MQEGDVGKIYLEPNFVTQFLFARLTAESRNSNHTSTLLKVVIQITHLLIAESRNSNHTSTYC